MIVHAGLRSRRSKVRMLLGVRSNSGKDRWARFMVRTLLGSGL